MSIIPTPRPLPTPHPDVLCRAVSEGAVLLHTRDEVYFGLNEVGLLIWEMLPPACQSVDEVVERLAARFPEADAAEIRGDVEELIGELEQGGLVQFLSSSGDAGE